MSNSVRVIAIDDDAKHLDSLIGGLSGQYASPLRIHFTGEWPDIPPCPHVRLIFSDLHLVGGAMSDPAEDFAIIGGLIEDVIKPVDPYLILLWTRYPDYASEFRTSLDRLRNVAKPVAVLPLPKADYLDNSGAIENRTALAHEISAVVGGWLGSEGALGLRGGWGPIDDHEVDSLIETIYAARRHDTGRPVELED